MNQMSRKDKAEAVYGYVSGKIKALTAKEQNNKSWQRATLAKLRRGVGREPGETPEVYEITLEHMPEALRSENDIPSSAEQAIHLSLTLFALHQQGNSGSANHSGISFGSAAKRLVESNKANGPAVKRRFDAALTAKNLVEFSHHARGLIQMMKAKGIFMDYPQFAKNLYWYQSPDHRRTVVFSWGKDFWAPKEASQNKNENQKENRDEGADHE
jgi:CRISPR system Cascade subunit CasB